MPGRLRRNPQSSRRATFSGSKRSTSSPTAAASKSRTSRPARSAQGFLPQRRVPIRRGAGRLRLPGRAVADANPPRPAARSREDRLRHPESVSRLSGARDARTTFARCPVSKTRTRSIAWPNASKRGSRFSTVAARSSSIPSAASSNGCIQGALSVESEFRRAKLAIHSASFAAVSGLIPSSTSKRQNPGHHRRRLRRFHRSAKFDRAQLHARDRHASHRALSDSVALSTQKNQALGIPVGSEFSAVDITSRTGLA